MRVFVSCGQRTEEERALGRAIGALISDLTPFEPYFAEDQTTLEGLTTDILMALNDATGLVVVLHDRGFVAGADITRGSVWVEQEIAIAAFIRQVLGRHLHIAAYRQEQVGLEGMRGQLLLNPKVFRSNEEVLKHLRRVLPTWSEPEQAAAAGLDVTIRFEEEEITERRHDYKLLVILTNNGTTPVQPSHVEVEFPSLVSHGLAGPTLVRDRSTQTHDFYRISEGPAIDVLYGGDSRRIFERRYYVDDDILFNRSDVFALPVIVRVFPEGGGDPLTVEKPLAQLQVF